MPRPLFQPLAVPVLSSPPEAWSSWSHGISTPQTSGRASSSSGDSSTCHIHEHRLIRRPREPGSVLCAAVLWDKEARIRRSCSPLTYLRRIHSTRQNLPDPGRGCYRNPPERDSLWTGEAWAASRRRWEVRGRAGLIKEGGGVRRQPRRSSYTGRVTSFLLTWNTCSSLSSCLPHPSPAAFFPTSLLFLTLSLHFPPSSPDFPVNPFFWRGASPVTLPLCGFLLRVDPAGAFWSQPAGTGLPLPLPTSLPVWPADVFSNIALFSLTKETLWDKHFRGD